MEANDLLLILQKYPEAIEDPTRLVNILKDCFPSERPQIRLLEAALEIDILRELQTKPLDRPLLLRLKKRLMDEFSLQQSKANWAVFMWSYAYGYGVLGKTLTQPEKPAPHPADSARPTADPAPPPEQQQAKSAPQPVQQQAKPTQQPVRQQTNPAPQPVRQQAKPTQQPVRQQMNPAPRLARRQARPAPSPPPPTAFRFILVEETDGWYIRSYSGTLPERLTIPAVVEGKKVTGISNGTFCNSGSSSSLNRRESGKALQSVTIEAGIRYIGERAFENCERLQSVYLPETLKTIGREAFGSCKSLSYICLPNGLTEIHSGAFQYCKNITSISIPGSVATIGSGAFMGCGSLENVKLSHGLKTIELSAFRECPKLKEAILPDSVKTIGLCAFCDDVGLKRLRLNEGLISIGEEAFLNCSLLRDVTLPKSLTSMGRDPFHTYLEDWYTTGTWNWRRRSFLEKIKTLAEVSLRDWLRRLRKDPTVTTSGAYRKNKQLTMYCHRGTYGAAYAKRAGYRVRKPAKAPAWLR